MMDDFDAFTAVTFSFFCEILKYVQIENKILSYSMGWLLTGLTRDVESRLAQFHINSNHLVNEIYHFSRLSI